MTRQTYLPAIASLGLLAVLFSRAFVCGQEVSGLDAAVTMEKVLVTAIARAEKSVVAIARVRKEQPGEVIRLEPRPDPFGRRPASIGGPEPTDPDFIPNEFATGVVVDRRGLILTVYHALGEQSDYYVTTAARKVYRATIKAADPRSDLAVLAIDATDLAPIPWGDASTLKKGRVVIALGNPYAIARDGQVSAAWGIVANLARKAPPTPGDYETAGKTTLHHFGTLIQTDAKLNLGTSGGPLLDLDGRMVGLVTAAPAAAGFEPSAGYAIPVDATFRRVVETLKQGREVEYGFLGIQPANLAGEGVARRFAGDAGGAGAAWSRHPDRRRRPSARRRRHGGRWPAGLRRRRPRAGGRPLAGRVGRPPERPSRRPATRLGGHAGQVSRSRQTDRDRPARTVARFAGRLSHGAGRRRSPLAPSSAYFEDAVVVTEVLKGLAGVGGGHSTRRCSSATSVAIRSTRRANSATRWRASPAPSASD